MRLYENRDGEAGLFELPDSGQPAFPTLVGALRGRALELLEGRWIRFPTVSRLWHFWQSFVSDTLVLANFTA